MKEIKKIVGIMKIVGKEMMKIIVEENKKEKWK